jgi:DNA-binding cell septation regulator SpoVG
MLTFKESIDHWINSNVRANLKESIRKDFEEIKEER